MTKNLKAFPFMGKRHFCGITAHGNQRDEAIRRLRDSWSCIPIKPLWVKTPNWKHIITPHLPTLSSVAWWSAVWDADIGDPVADHKLLTCPEYHVVSHECGQNSRQFLLDVYGFHTITVKISQVTPASVSRPSVICSRWQCLWFNRSFTLVSVNFTE